MADALVPYGDRRIVLRHNDTIVLYDANSRRLAVRNANHAIDAGECPACHRPYHTYQDGSSVNQMGGEGNPEYFRMLQQSLPEGPLTSPPPSPIKQLAQPAVPQGRSPPSTFRDSPEPPTFVPHTTGISADAFTQGYFKKFFQEEGELGRGGKGIVLLARHVIDGVDLGQYACKRIPVGNDHDWLIKIFREVQLLSSLAHENLVQYKHVWLEEFKLANFGPPIPCAFVLQQYCNGGDLHRFIYGGGKPSDTIEVLKERYRRRSRTGSEPELSGGLRRLCLDEIYSFFKQITTGINYLHVNNYVHRDLKPSNCLLHDTGSELRVLVSDFGEVQMGDQAREGTGATGTISYCAPEVLKHDSETGALGEFTTKADIFSLGMVLHFLCFGQLPYHSANGVDEDDEDVEQLKDEIAQWTGFEDERHLRTDLPDELYQHLSRLLSTNPHHRPSAENILQGLESLGSAAPPGSRSGHTRTRSHERNVDSRRGSKTSSAGPGALAANSTALAPAPILRRHITPPEPDFSASAIDESEESVPMARRDSLVLHTASQSRATSPLKDGTPFSPPPASPGLPRLLTAGPGHPPSRFSFHLSTPVLRTVQMVAFALKLFSLYLPCLPSAVKPKIALPLFALATADFVVLSHSLWSSITLTAIHVTALLIVNSQSDLCLGPRKLWSDSMD